MKEVLSIPIFCDNCPELAMALFDNATLCASCIKKSVLGGGVENLQNRVRPLVITSSRFTTTSSSDALSFVTA